MTKPQVSYYQGVLWVPLYNRSDFTRDLGFIPTFLNANDERTARDQISANYIGGWFPFKGFKLLPNGNLAYPDDPPTQALWMGKLRDETLHFYQHAWFRITQPDGGWEVAHLD